jgi:hypothetical protein
MNYYGILSSIISYKGNNYDNVNNVTDNYIGDHCYIIIIVVVIIIIIIIIIII